MARSWSETEEWLDKLSEDLHLNDAQYLFARIWAVWLANHQSVLSPLVIAALAVDIVMRQQEILEGGTK